MRPARPARLFVDDVRDIPMLETHYGLVPITHVSAGMKRILGLAYLLVWSWHEHLRIAEILRQEPAQNIVFIVDEIEVHLHPRWQRTILPSLMAVANALDPQIQVQAIATTHSPLVLASTEPWFDESRDRLFLLELENQLVMLAEMPWAKQGDMVGWLTSEIFGLKQARSQEAEVAIEAAEAWMRSDWQYEFPDMLHTPEQIHQELLRVLPGHDPFWARWIVRMERQQA
jgi:AAA domain, putative AbiEii toxin, Type IV TA system